jgi:hypothetical protein
LWALSFTDLAIAKWSVQEYGVPAPAVNGRPSLALKSTR